MKIYLNRSLNCFLSLVKDKDSVAIINHGDIQFYREGWTLSTELHVGDKVNQGLLCSYQFSKNSRIKPNRWVANTVTTTTYPSVTLLPDRQTCPYSALGFEQITLPPDGSGHNAIFKIANIRFVAYED